ncbi:MAG: molybdenum cofactor biosynthesis protein MoaE, partial [Rhodospirillaceae bacterium]
EISAFCTRNANSGGIATFVGQMRDFRGDSGANTTPITSMSLEHYPGMAERQLQDIAATACGRWPLDDILIVHRYGTMKPGEQIVLVAVASAHREPAFGACQFLMDWLKTQAPFWKKEISSDGSHWVEATADDAARSTRWASKES